MEVKEMKPEVLAQIVGFMYGEEIDSESFTNRLGLLDAAERFQMDDLKEEVKLTWSTLSSFRIKAN
jgi:hypothetical protein